MNLSDSLRLLRWATFEVTLRAEGHLRLPPYKGSVLRGAFGATFKRLVCVMPHRNCDICLLRQQCVYAVDFETPVQVAGGKKVYAPHPFVLEPPPETRTDYEPGDGLTFGLVLIGRAVEHLPYFIYTFGEMGKVGIGRGRGQCEVEAVQHVGLDGTRTATYDGTAKQLVTGWRVATGADPFDPFDKLRAGRLRASLDGEGDASSVSLDFLTPTRLRVKDDLVIDLDFETLIRALLRRISSLCEHHCGGRLDLDYRGLVGRARAVRTARRDLHWRDWERYSARQKTTMKLGGFVGQIAFEGNLSEFLPLLRIGSCLHVGKGTAFGLGMYKVIGE